MVHTTANFVAAPGDELTRRTLPVFFSVLDLLVRAGVTTVAEAAFQDRVWRPRLEPFHGLARIRIVHAVVAADVAFQRIVRRNAENPLRRAHADLANGDAAARARSHSSFDRVSIDAPWIEVDTTDGYRPALSDIVEFVGTAG